MLHRLKTLLGGTKSAAADVFVVNAYSTLTTPPTIDFPHQVLGKRNLGDPELQPHLDGFIGYVLSRGDGQMTRTRYHLMRHLQRVQQHLSLSISAADNAAFSRWAEQANAVAFMKDGSVRDPQGRILLNGDGQEDSEAQVPYPQSAWQRKARSEALLAEHGIRVASLPPLVSEPELQLRSAAEVAGRVMALLAVAARAESLNDHNNKPLTIDALRQRLAPAFSHLSPREQAYLQDDAPEEKDTIQMIWRYESLTLLEWAVGLLSELPFPTGICDVPQVARNVLDIASEDWPAKAQLRPAAEILDALDLHYRLHWIKREAELGRRALPDGLVPGVILERHYALNWLVRFENAEWDEVDTPT